MRPFDYARPTNTEQAARVLGAGAGVDGRPAAPLGGGTDLLALMKDDVVSPGRLVSLAGVEGLAGIRQEDGRIVLGAGTTLAEMAASDLLRREVPALAEAAGRVGSPQIRARGTLGGNLCQRPRCWYFRQGFGLLAMKDGQSMVRQGDHRFHAILGNDGPALFVSPSTVVPVLMVLQAEVDLVGPDGERTLPVGQLYRIPVREGDSELDLFPGEIVTAVHLAPPAGWSVASYEVRPGEALDWSLATAAVALELSGHVVQQARVVLGQVAPIPWTALEVEGMLPERKLTLELARQAGDKAVEKARPLSRNRYKVQLARVAVERALRKAAGLEA